MAVDPTVLGGARVLLYDSAGLVEGIGGVLIGVAGNDRSLTTSGAKGGPVGIPLVAPWLSTLNDSKGFAVALIAGPQPAWYRPETVEIFRLEGASEDSSVAAIVLAEVPSVESVTPSPGSGALRAAFEASGDLRQSIGGFIGPEFAKNDLTPPTEASVSAATASRVEATRKPEIRTTLGTAPTVTEGLCRIFHWD